MGFQRLEDIQDRVYSLIKAGTADPSDCACPSIDSWRCYAIRAGIQEIDQTQRDEECGCVCHEEYALDEADELLEMAGSDWEDE